jgi:hypothetical protein
VFGLIIFWLGLIKKKFLQGSLPAVYIFLMMNDKCPLFTKSIYINMSQNIVWIKKEGLCSGTLMLLTGELQLSLAGNNYFCQCRLLFILYIYLPVVIHPSFSSSVKLVDAIEDTSFQCSLHIVAVWRKI